MLLKTIIFAVLAVVVLADETKMPAPQIQQVKDLIKEQCKKNGAEDKATDVENAGQAFVDCVRGLVDVQELNNEIAKARPTGDLDEVFKKYCNKAPQLKTCISNLLNGVSPCVETTARDSFPEIINGTNQLIDFICYKDGDRIALFIAEGGPECFQSKVTDIKTCGENFKNSISSVDEAKKLTINERCEKYDQLVTCIVQKLETCETPTPSNMFESLARFVRNSSTCPKK